MGGISEQFKKRLDEVLGGIIQSPQGREAFGKEIDDLRLIIFSGYFNTGCGCSVDGEITGIEIAARE